MLAASQTHQSDVSSCPSISSERQRAERPVFVSHLPLSLRLFCSFSQFFAVSRAFVFFLFSNLQTLFCKSGGGVVLLQFQHYLPLTNERNHQ